MYILTVCSATINKRNINQMINTNPLVSIIIPVYNVERYLNECIESCINQTFKNLEIILINDGSTDSSPEICERYSNVDNRIKIVHKENGGLSSARNEGLRLVKSDYIIFLDSDDWIELNTVELALNAMEETKSDIVFWNYNKRYLNKDEVSIYSNSDYLVELSGKDLKKIKRRILGLINNELSNPTKTDAFISAWGKLYKTELIKENNLEFLPTQIVGSEDAPFNIFAFHYAQKICYLPFALNNYRMYNESSLTKHHQNTLFPRFKNLYFHLEEFIDNHNLNEEYNEALKNRFALSLINCTLSITSKNFKASFLEKRKAVKEILSDSLYQNCLKNIRISSMPFQWKIFFTAAKLQFASLIVIISLIYRNLIHD